MPTYVAMWSGPRNISTALMRSWGSRPDTFVCDEPLYAHYLVQTGLEHPGREEVIASQENDWRAVVEWLTGEIPEGKEIFYQKHMAHHLLPNIGRDWLARVSNVFLIREPREMLTSLLRVTPNAGIDDTGLPQQWEMFTRMREETGSPPAVIDSRDVLEDPRGVLQELCAALGVRFMEAMLSWVPGPRRTDGVWAPHWYAAVEASTGFGPYRPKDDEVPPGHLGVLRECEAYYTQLYEFRLTA
jgi:hypothetical protein